MFGATTFNITATFSKFSTYYISMMEKGQKLSREKKKKANNIKPSIQYNFQVGLSNDDILLIICIYRVYFKLRQFIKNVDKNSTQFQKVTATFYKLSAYYWYFSWNDDIIQELKLSVIPRNFKWKKNKKKTATTFYKLSAYKWYSYFFLKRRHFSRIETFGS